MGSPLPSRLLLPSHPPPEPPFLETVSHLVPPPEYLWASPTLSATDTLIPSPSWLHHCPGPAGFPPPRHPHLLHQQVLVGDPHPQSLLLASIPHAGPSHTQGQTWLELAGAVQATRGPASAPACLDSTPATTRAELAVSWCHPCRDSSGDPLPRGLSRRHQSAHSSH